MWQINNGYKNNEYKICHASISLLNIDAPHQTKPNRRRVKIMCEISQVGTIGCNGASGEWRVASRWLALFPLFVRACVLSAARSALWVAHCWRLKRLRSWRSYGGLTTLSRRHTRAQTYYWAFIARGRNSRPQLRRTNQPLCRTRTNGAAAF